MKNIKALIFILFISYFSNAQTVTHTIKQGETIGAVAKKYGVSTNEVLQLNGLNEKTILKIGQIIKIPSKNKAAVKNTEPQKDNPTKNQLNKGEKYLIVKGDNLDKIAKKFDITKQELIEWNNLKDDKIRAGDYLIVNNLKKIESKVDYKKEVSKPETQKKEPQKKVEIEKTKESDKPVNSDMSKQSEFPKSQNQTNTENTQKEVKPDDKPINVINDLPPTSSNKVSESGAFEGQFDGNGNSTIEGTCGIFKTIAGWHDKKYYILIDNIASGSVVKVTVSDKFVYAKVLGPLPENNSDKKFKMRISNATAAALGVKENNFNVKVVY